MDRDPADQARLRKLADEQAALRRVATLVARGAAPEEVFTAVAEEVGHLLHVELATLFRYEPGHTATSVTTWGPAGENLPVGVRWPLEGRNVTTLVLARRSAVPVELDLRVERRLPDQVEVAAYYAVSEALANAAKHARASVVQVELGADDAMARLTVRDDGIGGADPARGSGLTGLSDRIEAVGGTFDVTSPADGGTTLLIKIPV